MTHDLPWSIRGTNCEKKNSSSIKIHKFKLEIGFLLTVLNPLSYFLLDLLRSSCNGKNSSAFKSYLCSDSSTAVAFSHLHINPLHVVLQSSQLFACHISLVRDPFVRSITHLKACTGPLKGTREFGQMHFRVIAKPINSLDLVAYARCSRRSVESHKLQKHPCMYLFLDATLESTWPSAPRVVAAILVSCRFG
jgi:hypothetical protein